MRVAVINNINSMTKIFTSILKSLIKAIKLINTFLVKSLVNMLNSLDKGNKTLLPLEMTSYDVTGRFLIYVFNNPNNLSGPLLIESLYNSLWNQKDYLEFGTDQHANGYKILISTGVTPEAEFNLHPNILLANYTTQEEYVKAVLNGQKNTYNHLDYSVRDGMLYQDFDYDNFMIVQIVVRVWSYKLDRNKHIKITKTVNSLNLETSSSKPHFSPATISSRRVHGNFGIGRSYYSNFVKPSKSILLDTAKEVNTLKIKSTDFIKPLTKEAKSLKEFTTLDIETMDFCGLQIPLMVSFSHPSFAIKIGRAHV